MDAVTPPRHDLAPLVAGSTLALAAGLTAHPAPLVVLLLAALPLAPRPRWPLLAFAGMGLVMNGLFSWHGDTVLWRAPFTLTLLGRPRLTLEALALGAVTGLRLALLALGLGIALSRTPPQALARLVPGVGPRLATTLGLRALPDTVQDARAMRVALRARGVPTGGARGAAGLLVPLVARGLDRSMATVEVLHARGAGARPRPSTRLRLGAMGGLALACLAGLVALRVLGPWPDASFLPALALGSLRTLATWTPLVALPALLGLRRTPR